MQSKITRLFKALSSETRLKIIELLLKNPSCEKDLSKCLRKNTSTICRHIRELSAVGLVDFKKEGKKIIVKLKDKKKIRKLLSLVR